MKIFNSFWKPSFYQNKEGKSFWAGLLRVVLVNLVIGLVYASIFHVSVGKNIPEYFDSFSNQAMEGYPDGLVLSLKNGVLSKNITGELSLYPISKSLDNAKTLIDNTSISKSGYAEKVLIDDTPDYLISIDETKEASLASFVESEAFVFLGKDGLISKSNNKIQVLSYKDIQGVKEEETFSKATLSTIIDFIGKFKNNVAPILFVFIVIMYAIFASIWQMLFVLFLGLIVMLLSKWIIKEKTNYSDSYIYSLYAIPTISILVKILEKIPYISAFVSIIPFFTTLLTIFFLWYMFRSKENKNVVAPVTV